MSPQAENNVYWNYLLDGATYELGTAPSAVPAGEFCLLAGIDGRYDGTLRRYPGHIRYADVNDSLGATGVVSAASAFTVSRAEYIELQAVSGANTRVRGFIVADQAAGAIELWYRQSSDTTGQIRRQVMTTDWNFSAGTAWGATTRGRFIYFLSNASSNNKWTTFLISEASTISANVTSGTSVVTLNTLASSAYDDYYNGVNITLGSENKTITAFNATTHVATISGTWASNHNAGDAYTIFGFRTTPFGPVRASGSAYALTSPVFSGSAGGGRLLLGDYKAAFRYYDPVRGRFSPLSPADNHSSNATNGWLVSVSPAANSANNVSSADVGMGWSKVQAFLTLSSLDTTVVGGGTFYKIYENAASPSATASWTVQAGANSDGLSSSSLSDASFPLVYAYNPVDDEVVTLGKVHEVLHAQDVTWVLEENGSFFDLRWSPTFRVEPENFPSQNTYRTQIPVSQSYTVKMIQAGDYMYVFGGDRVYRVQRVGNTVGITELLQGWPFVHRDSILRVGSTIYAPTDVGIMQIDARSGSATFVPGTERLFTDRWRNAHTSNSVSSLRAGYDSHMGCVYFHAPTINETLCLWLTTGKVSLLLDNPASHLVSGLDIEQEVSERAYFITTGRYLYYPNAELTPTQPQTMTGLQLYTGQTTIKYNAAITAVGTVTVGGITYLTITFGSSAAFTSNGSTVLGLYGMPIFFLNGVQADTAYIVQFVASGGNTLTLTSTSWGSAGAPSVGDIVSFSPIPMLVVGGSLWPQNARLPDQWFRRVCAEINVAVGRQSSGDASGRQQTAPAASDYGILKCGASRHDNLTSVDPSAGIGTNTNFSSVIPSIKSTAMVPGAALDTNAPQNNWTRLNADGTLLFPWLACLTSNLQFELLGFVVRGERTPSQNIGQ